MSRKNRSSASQIFSLVLTGGLIAGSFFVWQSRQAIADAISYHQYQPTPEVRALATQAELTDDAEYMFYVSQPKVSPSQEFNRECDRREASSPILGCYASNRIYIYDVTDDRLDGLQAVTAAHEMLHAVYQRMSDQEKQRLSGLLETAYENNRSKELDERLNYYERTEPGQRSNELHSILGTEAASLSPELEEYYAKYFKDRADLVRLHAKVEQVFNRLSSESERLTKSIEQLANTINENTSQYNTDVSWLNRDVAAFNVRAQRSGEFSTQSEFEAARNGLVRRSNSLASLRQSIEQDVSEYKELVRQLETINAESVSLNKSIDSSLSDAPEI